MDSERKNFLVPIEQKYTCEHCGQVNQGGRYHNHCPRCLYSKHVDQQIPGDRASQCQGLMEPIAVINKKGKWRLRHHCLECGKEALVDTQEADNQQLIIKLSTNPVK